MSNVACPKCSTDEYKVILVTTAMCIIACKFCGSRFLFVSKQKQE